MGEKEKKVEIEKTWEWGRKDGHKPSKGAGE